MSECSSPQLFCTQDTSSFSISPGQTRRLLRLAVCTAPTVFCKKVTVKLDFFADEMTSISEGVGAGFGQDIDYMLTRNGETIATTNSSASFPSIPGGLTFTFSPMLTYCDMMPARGNNIYEILAVRNDSDSSTTVSYGSRALNAIVFYEREDIPKHKSGKCKFH
ncbi:hypothetical protein LC087_10560 [Bacillus carboniphilus]|uniref:Uncharacterized protein n=1 Tax=Bacillus carboniphilus TaxID=86663 RepID=A0ABY9JRB2_9BACI|nr:hypothetical protein [Bacillus carboniphilus]WLR41354.1 hypothetical protein LC087_10560 [Bacillus carboniphilus]